jgi:collagenase-like PrtC family protease
MKTILIKYITLGIFIISLIYLIKLVDKQSREIRDLKDIHTSELCTIDSLQQVHIVTEKQFKRIILSKDSLLKSELEKKDLKNPMVMILF